MADRVYEFHLDCEMDTSQMNALILTVGEIINGVLLAEYGEDGYGFTVTGCDAKDRDGAD